MAYRNKTFVSFASEDLAQYRLMTAWKANDNIDFNFHDAHDVNTALDTSQPDTIRRRLRERLANTKQVVLLVGDRTRSKAGDINSFIYYEVDVIAHLGLPVVFANLNGARTAEKSRIPRELLTPYTISVSFQPAIIKYALDYFPTQYEANRKVTSGQKTGPYHYKASGYKDLGI
jgi:antiphage defense system Thoeris ThsB-like protein